MRIGIITTRLCAGIAVTMLLGCGAKPQATHRPVPRAVVGLPEPSIDAPVRAPGAEPEIVALGISRDIFGSGDLVRGWLITSTNVAAAQARVESYALPLRRERPGHFTLDVKIPKLPSFVKRDYTMVISATNADGVAVKATVPIHVR